MRIRIAPRDIAPHQDSADTARSGTPLPAQPLPPPQTTENTVPQRANPTETAYAHSRKRAHAQGQRLVNPAAVGARRQRSSFVHGQCGVRQLTSQGGNSRASRESMVLGFTFTDGLKAKETRAHTHRERQGTDPRVALGAYGIHRNKETKP